MRILTLDIETMPHLVHTWGLFDQNIGLNQIVKPGYVGCFAAKWLGEKKVHFASVFHDGHEQMVQSAWELMSEADSIIHFNGKGFDVKHLHREFALQGLGPPSPHKDIDLLTVARGRFKFASNKLQHISEEFGIGSKLQHEGFPLWTACMADDEKAWAKMRRYCMQDVRLTEDLYTQELVGWVKGHPNLALEAGIDGCANCGSEDLFKNGFNYTSAGKYQRLGCQNCGAWSRGIKNLSKNNVRPIS